DSFIAPDGHRGVSPKWRIRPAPTQNPAALCRADAVHERGHYAVLSGRNQDDPADRRHVPVGGIALPCKLVDCVPSGVGGKDHHRSGPALLSEKEIPEFYQAELWQSLDRKDRNRGAGPRPDYSPPVMSNHWKDATTDEH